MDFENNCVKTNKVRSILSAAKMFSRDSLVSGDIRFMRIFAGVRKFLCKFSLDLRMHVSSDTVLVILQITKIVIL